MAIELAGVKAEVLDVGDGVLLARATFPDGTALEARGWVDATTNHYDPAAYHEYALVDGKWVLPDAHTPADAPRDVHRDPDAKPRPMTPAEVGEYALRLIVEQNAQRIAELRPKDVAAPTPIAFTVPPDSEAARVVAELAAG